MIRSGVYGPLAAKVILLNPIAQVVQDVRYNLITDATVTTWSMVGARGLLSILLVIIVLILAAIFFRRKSRRFAEEV